MKWQKEAPAQAEAKGATGEFFDCRLYAPLGHLLWASPVSGLSGQMAGQNRQVKSGRLIEGERLGIPPVNVPLEQKIDKRLVSGQQIVRDVIGEVYTPETAKGRN